VRLFGQATYDRSKTQARAAKAEARGRKKRAIAEYRRLLEHEPENTVWLGKLAALLARSKHPEEALQKFAVCAEGYEKQGFDEKALAVYRQAAGLLPKQVELWSQIARLHVKRGHAPDAIRALLEGRAKLKKKTLRASAVRLLREALKIEPWHFAAALDLARLLAKDDSRAEARRLCEGLCQRVRGRELRIARAALFRVAPSWAAAWRWLRAALRGR
jgi:tetratricopeptide (TPR) repeat protein